MTISFIAYPIYSVGVVFYIASIISGGSYETKTLWKLGVKYWLPYTILITLIVVAIVCGFILFIIPGIIFLGRYAFSEFDLLFNQSKPLTAMKNSWKATKEYIWIILGGFAVITIALYMPYYFIASLLDESNIFYWVLETVLNIVYSILGVLYTIFAFRVYVFADSQYNQPLIQNPL